MASAAPDLAALARDRAFETLYRRYAGDVYRYALALLRNPADAEDVSQTTFLNAYRAIKRGEEIEKPQNWLIKIAHNAARSRYARASRRVSEVPLEDHLEQLAVPEVERPHVQGVLDALGRLPLNQRAALVMRELEGRTYVEIADTLDVSVPAVETLIFRARRSLRVKASDIRVLSVVPAPGWLWKLLDGGGAAGGGAAGAGGAALGGGGAVGGGTVMGSGLLLKAAVAIVAGVVASGINSDRPRQADAARSLSSVTRLSAVTGKARSGSATNTVARPLGGAASGVGGSTAASGRLPGVDAAPAPSGRETGALQGAGAAGADAVGSAMLSPASGPSHASSALTLPSPAKVVSTVVETATNAVPLPSVPSLPVSVPALPPPAVQVPLPPVHVPAPPAQVPSPPIQVPSPPPVQLPPPPVHLP